ncbi:hypothetical protein M0805_008184 [Coniferiporia weirii]|nr:hypothetical protein M0805_008184 [Coniferiporia weirii]
MTPMDRDGAPPQYPVCGDFNCCHHSWSNLHANHVEVLKAQPLDDFFHVNGLEPVHDPDSDSCPHDSIRHCPIDMVWTPPTLDANSIMDTFKSTQTALSNHACLKWAILTSVLPPIPQTRLLTADDFMEWSELAYPALDCTFELWVTDTASLDLKAATVVKAMEDTLAPFTSIVKLKKTKVAWWTPHCAKLLKSISSAPTALQHSRAQQAFKRGMHMAKHNYYSNQAKEANLTNIWSWAKRGLGVRPTQVPSLHRGDGSFTQSKEEKALPLLASELESVLASTSNLSAPGPSRISYHPLKWVVMHYPNEVLALFNDCLCLGHHPECWRSAKVVMLRKLNKKDPFSP